MKKILVSLILLAVIMMMGITTVQATTNAELLEFATSDHAVSGESIGLTDANRVKVRRYLTENPVTDEQAGQIMAKAQELINIMEKANVSDPAKLNQADKTKFMAVAQEGADVLDLKLVFHAHSVDIYKEGKLIENASLGDEKLAYTGNNMKIALVVSSIAVIALASGFVVKKRLANA